MGNNMFDGCPDDLFVDPGGGHAGRVLSERGAAGHLGVSDRYLRRWRSRGEGPPYVRLGTRVGYRIGDLNAASLRARKAHPELAPLDLPAHPLILGIRQGQGAAPAPGAARGPR